MFQSRLEYYALFTVVFGAIYGGVLFVLGEFPTSLLFGILLLSLGKDIYDEYRMRQGGEPLAFASIEHNPSNIVLGILLVTGIVDPGGTFVGIPLRWVGVVLAVADGLFDGWQDARAG